MSDKQPVVRVEVRVTIDGVPMNYYSDDQPGADVGIDKVLDVVPHGQRVERVPPPVASERAVTT